MNSQIQIEHDRDIKFLEELSRLARKTDPNFENIVEDRKKLVTNEDISRQCRK
jgi:hypothetical protein